MVPEHEHLVCRNVPPGDAIGDQRRGLALEDIRLDKLGPIHEHASAPEFHLVAAHRDHPVGVRYSDSNHAARPWYSWMSPPSRSRRRTSCVLTGEAVSVKAVTYSPDEVVVRKADAACDELATELARVARSAVTTADAARAQGLDPLTLRTLALDSGAGASLLQVAPLPNRHSYSLEGPRWPDDDY